MWGCLILLILNIPCDNEIFCSARGYVILLDLWGEDEGIFRGLERFSSNVIIEFNDSLRASIGEPFCNDPLGLVLLG